MSPRLKAQKPQAKTPSFVIFKLVVYGVLAVLLIGLLWYLYLGKPHQEAQEKAAKSGRSQSAKQVGGDP